MVLKLVWSLKFELFSEHIYAVIMVFKLVKTESFVRFKVCENYRKFGIEESGAQKTDSDNTFFSLIFRHCVQSLLQTAPFIFLPPPPPPPPPYLTPA